MVTNRITSPVLWLDTVPPEVLEQVSDKSVAEVSFGAGPGYIGGETKRYSPTVTLGEAVEWFRRYVGSLRGAHIGFTDKSGLWFWPNGFWKYEAAPHPGPRAGVLVRHPTSAP